MFETSSRVAWTLCGVLVIAASGRTLAATPPALTNYQGVLRGADDAPQTGTYDMVFSFHDALGNEILVDRHLAANAQAVTVENGLFSVALGGGQLADGSGPGTYASLSDVFRDFPGVWLEVRIGGETLSPRTRILASGYALNATHATNATNAASAADATQLAGQPASAYLNTGAGAQTKLGRVKFDNAAGSGFGVEAFGPDGGGYFGDSDQSGYAFIGYDNYGMYGYGNTMGAYFQDLNNSGYSYVAYGDLGIQSAGNDMGAYIRDNNNSGYSYIGYGDYGIQSYGNYMGGYFADLTESGLALVGFSGTGIRARGNTVGGDFADSNSTGYAYVGYGDTGIDAHGSLQGGYFSDTGGAGFARVGYSSFGGYGIMAYGYGGGGYFNDRDGSYAYAGYGAYKIYGTGTVSFVQNHPTRKDRTIVYAAPEGDEVAVYTRGSGRLKNGEARVALGETFALVANPDIGVTAHVTPRSDARLWVDRVSPSEIVVRGPADVDVAFDYLVYGLRIGFETLPIVQVKKEESYLPTAATLAEYEAGQPDTVASSALVRYSAEREQLAGPAVDLTRSSVLAAQINAGREEWIAAQRNEDEQRRVAMQHRASPDGPSSPEAPAAEPTGARASIPVEQRPVEQRLAPEAPAIDVAHARFSQVFKTSSSIEAGDVVAIDPQVPGSVRRADRPSDRNVVGIALAPAVDGNVEVAIAAVVDVRVDPAQGQILAGDLLVSSPTPGAAMAATVAEPGTIIGKALEPSRSGVTTIRALVMLR